ncbi:SLIT-ROBO Rho GTPase-activating protein 1-like isoform X2 [Nymphalis io]|uniref:SLIT-ROBO Rho GTPase-activating protein 1-like isoform X2 n=1 Tax=Inachis io TaxID=171585 RepID=UPI0021671974|nr:SLIT-ROBO Rho GTPase-activating protein 1-like isoform X2 [Nymphalis io]
MSVSGTTTPTAVEAPALDDRDMEPRTPMKRLGSTRKLAAFNNIRVQLSEQTRVLEARAEAAAGVAGELHDYCRRRADLEHEYSRALDKLARAAAQRHKDQKHKREQWPLTGAYACWQAALDNTRALSRDHAALADLYGGPLAARLQRAADDVLRLHRKCRDIVAERHEEVGVALAEAAAGGKAHAAAAAEWRAAALKLRHAHHARQALLAADPPRQKKVKALDKELEKRRTRHSEARSKALRARADYVLSLEAANATLQRYYLDDIADIMLCTEVGFEAVVGRAVRSASAAESARAQAASAAAGALLAAADALDALADRQRFVAAHPAAFALPRPLPYLGDAPPAQDKEMRELLEGAADERDEAADAAARDLSQRLVQLEASARTLRAECREAAKTLDAAEAELVRQMEGPDATWEVDTLFGASAVPPAPPPVEDDAPRRDQEDYYLAKFRSYVSCAGRLARLESKAVAVRERLLGAGAGAATPRSPPSPPRRAAARRRGHFAAPLDDRLPAVLTSCVRVIATYGLNHQGVFRVSGSQVEMQALRAAFERGEDPLADVRDASDINSVCGLLKLYLRELRPPLLPPQLQERLLRVAALPDDASFVRRLRDTLAALPLPSLLVLRYLFAFLAHLTEHADRNMMDAWNLAICLGPTLLAAWGEGGAQVAAQNLVNELVKRAILHHADVFPQDVAPHALYRRAEPASGPDAPGADATDAPNADRTHAAHDHVDDDDAQRDLSLYDDDDDDDDDDEGAVSDLDADADADADADWRRPAPRRSPSGERRAPQAGSDPPATTAHDTCSRLAESTPDLVLDLPARAADAADTFAHNRDTLKKRPAHPAHRQTCSEGGGEARAGDGEASGGSPVPARNTMRVAAKFAELTLTGGSLKPALAAKPALLRRPTPHPAHAPRVPAPPVVPPGPAGAAQSPAAPAPDDAAPCGK